MLLALSTGPTTYHLCVLVLTAALALDALLTLDKRWQACTLIALYAMVCFPLARLTSQNADGWHMFFASPRLYPLLALPFFLYSAIYRLPLVRARLHTHRRETWAFGAAFLLLGALGAIQALHHSRGLYSNYERRLFTTPNSLLGGEPSLGANALYFTRMLGEPPGFGVWSRSVGQLASLPPAEDEFHSTSAPTLADVWVERAGPVSNIVRFSNVDGPGVTTSQIEVANGEQPAVSPDGKWLAFIRENHGRGTLWIKAVGPNDGAAGVRERKLVDDSYDVWEAAVESSGQRIIFTAAPQGRPELYSLNVAAGRIVPMPVGHLARYPAFSPDGRWIAYSRSEQGNWHLYVTDLSSASSRRLTPGDCNSISPAWEPDSKSLIYATDCGRGLEMTALEHIELFHEQGD